MTRELELYPTRNKRFWSKVNKTFFCWDWTGLKSPGKYGGYGIFAIKPHNVRAHRWAWESIYGPIPEGRFICHTCDNPSCVRPSHLFLGTPRMNSLDMARKGRCGPQRYPERYAGELNGRAKITKDEALEIRREYKNSNVEQEELARKYGISKSQVSKITLNNAWA